MLDLSLYQNHMHLPITKAVFFEILVISGQKKSLQIGTFAWQKLKMPTLKGRIVIYKPLEISSYHGVESQYHNAFTQKNFGQTSFFFQGIYGGRYKVTNFFKFRKNLSYFQFSLTVKAPNQQYSVNYYHF